MNMVPQKLFFTRGVGVHKDKLTAFELALRDAGVQMCNLVYVSSIFPPKCKIIDREEGVKELKPGQVAFCVMARAETNEPNRIICSGVGLAIPKKDHLYGYISEHTCFGGKQKDLGEYTEHLASEMLATTLGVKLAPHKKWIDKKNYYKANGYILDTRHICQSAKGDKNELWTVAISAAVFII